MKLAFFSSAGDLGDCGLVGAGDELLAAGRLADSLLVEFVLPLLFLGEDSGSSSLARQNIRRTPYFSPPVMALKAALSPLLSSA